jgi:V/A-type H+-transporting ATPase subunit C
MFERKGSKTGNYAFASAKVKAKKAGLMGDDAYAKMLMMNLPEISRFIGESGYQKEMEELAGRIEGIDLIEHATYKNMARTFSQILHVMQGELRYMVSSYLTKWDLWNVKTILRGKTYGIDNEEIREDLVPAGKLDEEMLEKLLSLESDKEILAEFSKMEHLEISPEAINAYKADGHLRNIEDHLDKLYYKKLLHSIDPSTRPTRIFQDYVRREIDVVNLETILILKSEGIRGEEVMEYIIPGGKQIDKKLATQLANAESIAAAANDLAQLDLYEDIKEALDAGTGSLKDLVAGMNRYHMRLAKKFSHLYPLSVIPVLDYMIHKTNEVNNIRIIARGIESGIDKDTIKGLLVI